MTINPLRRWAAAALFFTAPFLAVDAKEVPSRLDVQRGCETFMAQCSLFDEPRLKRAAACACYVDLIMDNYTDASRLRALLDPFALAKVGDGAAYGLESITAEELTACRALMPRQDACRLQDPKIVLNNTTLIEQTVHAISGFKVLQCRYAVTGGDGEIETFFYLDEKDGRQYSYGRGTLRSPLRAAKACPKHPENPYK